MRRRWRSSHRPATCRPACRCRPGSWGSPRSRCKSAAPRAARLPPRPVPKAEALAPSPRSSGRFALLQQLELLDGHQDGAGLGAFARADDAALLEQVHDPPGTGEADLQLALQHRRRAQLAAHDELHRLTHQRLVLVVVGPVAAEVAAAELALALVALDPTDVDHLGRLAAPVGDDLADLLLGDERALDALGHVRAAGQQE